MDKDTALRLALETLEYTGLKWPQVEEAITAIKAALEAKDEPWEKFCDSHCVWTDHHPDCKLAKDEPEYYGLTKDHLWMSISKEHYDRLKPEFRMTCYTTPPQRTWVGLTDEEISAIDWKSNETLHDFARAIEAKLKDKNNG